MSLVLAKGSVNDFELSVKLLITCEKIVHNGLY